MKINLEQELLKQNRKVLLPEELLVLKEYEKFADVSEGESLSRIGINSSAMEGKAIKQKITESELQLSKFNKERVYHISQIESICNKYALRFLSSKLYKGTLDKNLELKITSFEAAHDVLMNTSNSFIIAPASSFKLQEKPKDPLLFYKINDENYYLIHKWGNDLSSWRKVYALFCHRITVFIAVFIVSLSLISLFAFYAHISDEMCFAGVFSAFLFSVLCIKDMSAFDFRSEIEP